MRPKGWENPYSSDKVSSYPTKDGTYLSYNPHMDEYDSFEAGADAMLEGLKKEGRYGLHHSDTFGGVGYLVFIEE